MSPSKFDLWMKNNSSESELDEWSYIYHNFNPEDVLLIAKLYWPVFQEINGMVIRDDVVCEFRNRIESSPPSSVIERSYNLLKLWDLFNESADEAIYIQLAEKMTVTWSAALNEQFKNKKFVVELINSEQSYGPMLTVYQCRKSTN